MPAKVRTIELKDIEPLTCALWDRLTSANFHPDLVIYLETGARLIAASFHKTTGIPAIPLTIRRSGSSSKARVSSLLAALPIPLQDLLRKLESRSTMTASNVRIITAAPMVNLLQNKILILDDAADSGESLRLARQWAIDMGADESKIKFATIAVTQPDAKQLVDFWVYSQICRFPWSSDSREREEYLKLYEQTDPKRFKAGNL